MDQNSAPTPEAAAVRPTPEAAAVRPTSRTGVRLGKIVAAEVRHPRAILLAALALAVLCATLAMTRLSVTTDTGALFAASLPWRQRSAAIEHAFPGQQNLLVAVVDGATPEEATETADALAAALSADGAHFNAVSRPDASPYLQREGLLFLDQAKLSTLLEATIDAQPFLGQLAADPSLRGLMSALGLLAQGVAVGQADLGGFKDALAGFHRALSQAAAGQAEPMSWERLLAGSLADLAGKYRFVLTRPVLDYAALEPGQTATTALRKAAAALPDVKAGRAHVRLTGQVALDDEEFGTVASGAVQELVLSLTLVGVILFFAVRSWRVAVPIILTLLLGLVVTTGFAAVAVGTLNLVSMAFAVLFTGIAVDFAIQYGVRFRAARLDQETRPALVFTARRAGRQILVASLASMAGFLAFTPAKFIGVAQLGLIAGVGMLIAFCCTLTVLPALLVLFRPPAGADEAGLAMLRPVDAVLRRRRRPIVIGFAVLAAVGVALVPWLQFDSDPLHTKDPNGEAVRTLESLLDEPVTDPYTSDVLAPSVQEAAALVPKLEAIPRVDSVMWIGSFVPEDQAPKLAMLHDAASLLAVTLSPGAPMPPPDAQALRQAVSKTVDALEAVRGKLPADSPALPIIGDLQKLRTASDAVLLAANTALTRFLPMQLDQLRTALGATPATEADVPEDIRREWLLPDGRAKLQVVPKLEVARSPHGLAKFVADVERVAPDAGGSAVTIVGSASTMIQAFRTAALLALGAIAVLLALTTRHLLDMALVLSSLLIASCLTVLLVVALRIELNFANIIALPLLLGVGVSFNVYFVMNWRSGIAAPLGSATARAVLFSALTTATAFGSLATSAHPGTASMGVLLLLSLGCTLLTTMVFLPSVLFWLGPPSREVER